MSLQVIDRKLLNLAQLEFPILQEPFAALGSRLGLNEDEVLKRLHYLKEVRIIRSIGPTLARASDGRLRAESSSTLTSSR